MGFFTAQFEERSNSMHVVRRFVSWVYRVISSENLPKTFPFYKKWRRMTRIKLKNGQKLKRLFQKRTKKTKKLKKTISHKDFRNNGQIWKSGTSPFILLSIDFIRQFSSNFRFYGRSLANNILFSEVHSHFFFTLRKTLECALQHHGSLWTNRTWHTSTTIQFWPRNYLNGPDRCEPCNVWEVFIMVDDVCSKFNIHERFSARLTDISFHDFVVSLRIPATWNDWAPRCLGECCDANSLCPKPNWGPAQSCIPISFYKAGHKPHNHSYRGRILAFSLRPISCACKSWAGYGSWATYCSVFSN